MIQSNSSDQTKAYFVDALSQADYYINDQELQGRFAGKLMQRLELQEKATKETFFALCENIDPRNGKSITPHTKESRRIGYDINFHCPKSVSMLHALAKDNHVLEAFEASVRATMLDIEADSKTRVRKDGKQEDRSTGELVWAEFTHQTARPVDSHTPDPHLHTHCFVFNATWDDVEKKFKAGQFGDIKRDMPYYQARFHKRLSDELINLGYQVRRTEKSFEIEGVPQQVIDLFSKRTDEIGRIAKEHGVTDAKELDELGARTRSRKQSGLSMEQLKRDWRDQIAAIGDTGDENQAVRYAPTRLRLRSTAERCVDFAVNHAFERASVMADRRILETAYRSSLGITSVTLDGITRAFDADERVIRVKDGSRLVCTTKGVLAEEKYMVSLAQKGQGACEPLYHAVPKMTLKDQQAEAVSHVLTTSDRVSIVRGIAGAGKTTLMKEAVSLIEKTGKKVTVVAPTAQASRGVLKDEGFQDAETVAMLLASPEMQEMLTGNVLWCDEAGLLGTKDMTDILEIVEQRGARVILAGDTRQHASVVRGDALRVLNTVGGIKTAEVNRIYRQKSIAYRTLVEDLARGDVKHAFEKLDNIGFIKSIDTASPNATLVNDYVSALKKGKSALVVSPTHKQGDEVTMAIRQKLRGAGLLGNKEIKAARLINQNLTEAEKSDWRSFQPGQMIQFNQNIVGAKRGSVWTVKRVNENQVDLRNTEGHALPLPLDKNTSFDLYYKAEIGLSKGDKIRITRNGFDINDKRLDNGMVMEVASVSLKGKIALRNGASKSLFLVEEDFGHIAHAHCITSHSAQGKTVDEVFISQPAATFAATDAKQFYVSVSRARDAAHIYTDDKEALLEHAAQLGDRKSALELVTSRERHHEHVRHQQQPQKTSRTKNVSRPLPVKGLNKDIDYEPRL